MRMAPNKFLNYFAFLSLPLAAHAGGEVLEPTLPTIEEAAPWFTGPLIAPTAAVVRAGHYIIQPYLAFNTRTGLYDHHWKNISTPNFFSYSTSVDFTFGLTDWVDVEITPAVGYNSTEGQSAWTFSDLPLSLGFQLLPTDRFKYFPGIELQIIETFPTGKYQKSNPKKLGTDIGGTGSFATTANLNFYKIYPLKGAHFLSMAASFGVTYFAPVHVRGINSYGGGPGCAGKVYPGHGYTAIVSFEFSLTQNWVLALDNVYTHLDKDHFRGTPGAPSPVVRPSSESLSFAPAIEYNFNENWGIIAGAWVSATGRNSAVFRNAIVSFEYQY